MEVSRVDQVADRLSGAILRGRFRLSGQFRHGGEVLAAVGRRDHGSMMLDALPSVQAAWGDVTLTVHVLVEMLAPTAA